MAGGLVDAAFELVEVDPVDRQRVAGVGPGQALGAEDPAEPADQNGHLVGRSRRRGVAPEHVAEPVDGHRVAAGQREQLEQGPRLPTPEGGRVDPFGLEGSEHMDPQPPAHRRPV